MKKLQGLTILELIIAISIFIAVGLIAVGIFVNITRIQGRIALESAIYEDARFMMERLSRSIKNNAIDYEEYFNQAINEGVTEHLEYGDLHGVYAALFYNPGKQSSGEDLDAYASASNPGQLGAFCTKGELYIGQDCVVYKDSLDINTGKFPYEGKAGTPSPSNAFCPQEALSGLTCDPNAETYPKDQLYLISPAGDKKTIFALKEIVKGTAPTPTLENALAMLEIVGQDLNNDGIMEAWRDKNEGGGFFCAAGYDCKLANGVSLADTLSTSKIYQGFVPISPLRTNIESLTFSVYPVEDPHKAFAETEHISNPRVVVTMTVSPSRTELNRFGNPENPPKLTLQTTISSRVQNEVKSYMGHDTYAIYNDITELVDLLN